MYADKTWCCYCRNEILPRAPYCPHCRKTMSEWTRVVKCPSCGAFELKSRKECRNCGAQLSLVTHPPVERKKPAEKAESREIKYHYSYRGIAAYILEYFYPRHDTIPMRIFAAVFLLLFAFGVMVSLSSPRATPNSRVTATSIAGTTISSDAPSQAGTLVYVTVTGEKYHVAGCQYLRDSAFAMPLSTAQGKGFEPCSVCIPQRLK